MLLAFLKRSSSLQCLTDAIILAKEQLAVVAKPIEYLNSVRSKDTAAVTRSNSESEIYMWSKRDVPAWHLVRREEVPVSVAIWHVAVASSAQFAGASPKPDVLPPAHGWTKANNPAKSPTNLMAKIFSTLMEELGVMLATRSDLRAMPKHNNNKTVDDKSQSPT